MARMRKRLSLEALRRYMFGRSGGAWLGRQDVVFVFVRIALVFFSGLIVTLGWFFLEREDSWRVGYPSPRMYLAQSHTRFVDTAATERAREQVADQIVTVRVRDERTTQLVQQRLANLKESDNLDFAPPQLVELLFSFPPEETERILDTAIEITERNFDRATSLPEQSALVWESLRRIDMGQAQKNVVYQLVDAILTPTVTDDEELTNRLRANVSQTIPPVVREVKLGAILVQRGQIVTPGLAEVLRNQGYPDSDMPWKNLWFIMLVTFIWSFWIVWLGVRQDVRITNKEWIYIVVVLAIDWSTQRWLAKWDIDSLSILAMTGWVFLTFNPMFAFHIALGGGLIGYLIAFPEMTSVIAVGCILAAMGTGAAFLLIKEAASRIMIWRNIFSLGICLTLTSLFIRWGFGLAVNVGTFVTYLILCAFWSSIVVAVLPLWEAVFEILSPLRLLEMSHPSQPLLKRLQLEAPGTYHHTITVASLAEAVADKLGLNGLLVRTGAYYHDIGKLKRPHYFVENQSFGDNIHDRLPAAYSAKIILQHVKDGQQLADEYKVPQGIKRFIAEHHGKTFLSYFYNKAVAEDKEAGRDGSGIDKADYTYPGPTPQSPETALLMLADSIEAAIKGLDAPLEGRPELEKLVGNVIDSKIQTGQFVDVDFTLKDLSAIKNAFVEVLMSMHHTREVKKLAAAPDEESAEPRPTRDEPVPEREKAEKTADTSKDSEPGTSDSLAALRPITRRKP